MTRVRQLKNKTEKSILDFFVVCEKIKTFLEKLIIDEDKLNPLNRYLKDGKKNSDHNTMIMQLNITFMEKRRDKLKCLISKTWNVKKNFLN